MSNRIRKYRGIAESGLLIYFSINDINRPVDVKKLKLIEDYIGVNDKHDKEIYEGDIVKAKIQAPPLPGYETFEVIWDPKKMRFGLKDIGSEVCQDSWAFTPDNDFEIIGNRHGKK